jgi:hypothetical protein
MYYTVLIPDFGMDLELKPWEGRRAKFFLNRTVVQCPSTDGWI